ncbi:MAG: hypothetical protein LQ349_002382 [Xanthoria aureola]|nr:MAG: hypothetical protein LQ349_002382 [Xanthoria aureola]
MSASTQSKSAKSLSIHQLSIANAFDGLTPKEKLYGHHLARAAWSGTRIILRQVSPEANSIFDFIMELARCCRERFSSSWAALAETFDVNEADMASFLEYAARFLSNIGNYYGSGDQKFSPEMHKKSLKAIALASDRATDLFSSIARSMFSPQPSSLGYPTEQTQSAYCPGEVPISLDEVAYVSQTMEGYEDQTIFEVLQASVETADSVKVLNVRDPKGSIRIVKGDHSEELERICGHLRSAAQYAARQKKFLEQYHQSFRTGDLEIYKESQKTWIRDTAPSVENIFGFVEPYRDPFGSRAEFKGVVAIANREETAVLTTLVEQSSNFINQLPWTEGFSENDGKGPFEKALFKAPNFSSIHALAYCSSIVFGGINLPNYNDIRQEHGFKNVIIANRMSAESNEADTSPFVHTAEAAMFQKHRYHAYYIWVVLHELLGHGTGRMMTEEHGKFSFDGSWYRQGQTWTGVFGDLATTVDECRAELVGAYLMDNLELLALFGYTSHSEIKAQDLTYNLYVQLGVDGLRGLQNFNVGSGKWGQAHSRAHFAMLKCLLQDGDGFMTVRCNSEANDIKVSVDRSRIQTNGKAALRGMLLRLHMYRCTADAKSCRQYYEDLSKVDGHYLEWRRVVLAQKQPEWVFVQANTFLDGEEVYLKEYEATPEGLIQSWSEREV